jgi:Ca2+-binding RTX toxin-like protein
MLGLLLMAGLGFAATALMEHVDDQPKDDEHSQDDEDHGADSADHDSDGPHGSLLDEPDSHHASPDEDTGHAGGMAHVAATDHGARDEGSAPPTPHTNPAHDDPPPSGEEHWPNHHDSAGGAGHHGGAHAGHHGGGHHEPHKPDHQTEPARPHPSGDETHPKGHHQTEDHKAGHKGEDAKSTDHPTDDHKSYDTANADTGKAAEAEPAAKTPNAGTINKVFGDEANDTLHGSASTDLMEGNGGDDKLIGHAGNDHLVSFDAGHDTIFGNRGDDSLHGYTVQHEPGNFSFVVEDHQADHLHGGLGKDSLFLGSDDVGTGGKGADSFHVSWDVEHGHPAEITDYDPAQDKIYIDYSTHHADADMTHIKASETTVTTEPMKDGSGTSIFVNGHAIAHVLGATDLQASDIGLIRS